MQGLQRVVISEGECSSNRPGITDPLLWKPGSKLFVFPVC